MLPKSLFWPTLTISRVDIHSSVGIWIFYREKSLEANIIEIKEYIFFQILHVKEWQEQSPNSKFMCFCAFLECLCVAIESVIFFKVLNTETQKLL